MTFQQLRDWHAAQTNNRALHQEAVRLLNSLIDEDNTAIDTTPYIGVDAFNAQLAALVGK